jgi:hypothetical protein
MVDDGSGIEPTMGPLKVGRSRPARRERATHLAIEREGHAPTATPKVADGCGGGGRERNLNLALVPN